MSANEYHPPPPIGKTLSWVLQRRGISNVEPADPETYQELYQKVEELSQKMKITTTPQIYVCDCEGLSKSNAMAIPGNPPKLVFSKGVLGEELSVITEVALKQTGQLKSQSIDDQQEGVIGHELSHVKHQARDLAVSTALMVPSFAFAAAQFKALWDGGKSLFSKKPWDEKKQELKKAVVNYLKATAGAVLTFAAFMGYRRQIEYQADKESGEATGKPAALADFLEENGRDAPFPHGKPEWAKEHPRTAKRVDRLRKQQEEIDAQLSR